MDDQDRTNKESERRNEYDFQKAVLAQDRLTSPAFGRHLGSTYLNDQLRQAQETTAPDASGVGADSALGELLERLSASINVGATLPTPAELPTEQTAADYPLPDLPVVLQSPLEDGPDLLGSSPEPPTAIDEPDLETPPPATEPELQELPAVAPVIAESVPDLPFSPVVSPVAEEPVELPPDVVPTGVPILDELGQVRPIVESETPPWFLAEPERPIASDPNLGVSPPLPEPTPREQGTTIVQFGHDGLVEPSFGGQGHQFDRSPSYFEQQYHDRSLDTELFDSEYDNQQLEWAMRMTDRALHLNQQYMRLSDALASEGEDDQ